MEAKPHQLRAQADVIAAMDRGVRRILVTAPTGAGKSFMICMLILGLARYGWSAVLYTNRRLLIDQLSRTLDAHGIPHGVRAAGHPENLDAPVQIASLQTEQARTIKRATRSIHGAAGNCIAIIDEAHLNASENTLEIANRHIDSGHFLVGFTASPIGLAGVYEQLIVAGTNSELRAAGMLVPVFHYGPDEPDLKRFKKELEAGLDLSEKKAAAAMGGRVHLFGRVWEWFEKLNPTRRPTILFAPGVAESLWFAEQFSRRGVSAAHIDGQSVWVNGESLRSSQDARDEVIEGSRDGRIVVVCNRFVMREGVDMPWLAHGILATVLGSLQTYLQAGGRLLRAYPGLDHVTMQDHGGNWWRHGSLNADRHWDLNYTPGMLAGMREDDLREKRIKEPVRCPKCGLVLMVRVCPCGYVVNPNRKSRPVVTSDGDLIQMRGDIYKPRRRPRTADAQALWTRCYFRAKNSRTRMTFRQAEALYVHESPIHCWPPRDLKFMPIEPHDLFRSVADVPARNLRS